MRASHWCWSSICKWPKVGQPAQSYSAAISTQRRSSSWFVGDFRYLLDIYQRAGTCLKIAALTVDYSLICDTIHLRIKFLSRLTRCGGILPVWLNSLTYNWCKIDNRLNSIISRSALFAIVTNISQQRRRGDVMRERAYREYFANQRSPVLEVRSLKFHDTQCLPKS